MKKTFTIENKSESEYKYNIIIKDLVNTFVTNNLQYKITNTSSNGGYSMSEFENITKSETKKKKTLAYNVSISSGVKQVYRMEKNDCDFVLANDLQEIGADFHKGYLIHKDGSCDTMETNEEIADRIAQRVMTACRERSK